MGVNVAAKVGDDGVGVKVPEPAALGDGVRGEMLVDGQGLEEQARGHHMREGRGEEAEPAMRAAGRWAVPRMAGGATEPAVSVGQRVARCPTDLEPHKAGAAVKVVVEVKVTLVALAFFVKLEEEGRKAVEGLADHAVVAALGVLLLVLVRQVVQVLECRARLVVDVA